MAKDKKNDKILMRGYELFGLTETTGREIKGLILNHDNPIKAKAMIDTWTIPENKAYGYFFLGRVVQEVQRKRISENDENGVF